MNWHKLIDWQIESFGGNPAVMVHITNGPMKSVYYTADEVVRRGLADSIQTHWGTHEGVNYFAAQFKPGAVSFAFVHDAKDYEQTTKALKAIYPLVHYNSLMAGSGLDNPEVKRALDDFCKGAGVPWREFLPGVWTVHHCHRMGQ